MNMDNQTLIWAISLLVLILLVGTLNTSEGFIGYYMGGKTKCFSCEADMIARGGPLYMGRPTKSFASERDLATRGVPPHFAQPSSCYSCMTGERTLH